MDIKKLKAIQNQLERFETLNKENVPTVIELLKEKIGAEETITEDETEMVMSVVDYLNAELSDKSLEEVSWKVHKRLQEADQTISLYKVERIVKENWF